MSPSEPPYSDLQHAVLVVRLVYDFLKFYTIIITQIAFNLLFTQKKFWIFKAYFQLHDFL